MSVSLTSNFLSNARGLTFEDANGISWSLNPNSNQISASYTGSGSAGANPTAKVGLSAVNGSLGTFMRSDGAPPIDQAITPTWTGLHTFSGGITVTGTITLDGHTFSLTGNASVSGTNTGDQVVPTAANPSGSIGLSAANGSATTFARSDATHALSVAISPTWSGNHTFSNPVVLNAAPQTFNGVTASTASGTPVTIATLSAVGVSVFLVSIGISGSGGASQNIAVAIVRQTVGATVATTIASGSNMTISVSGLAIQATQATGVAQVINYNIIQIM